MFKARIARWKFSKNSTDKDWKVLAVLLKRRENEGKRATEFMVHDRKKSAADILRHIKGKNISEKAFLADAWDLPVPQYVRCYTPEPAAPCRPPSQGSSSEFDDILFTPSSSESPPKSFSAPLTRGQLDTLLPQRPDSHSSIEIPIRHGGHAVHTHEYGERALGDRPPEMVSISQLDPPHELEPCDHLRQYLRGISIRALTPDSAASKTADEDSQSWTMILKAGKGDLEACCSKCGQPVIAHKFMLDNHPVPAPLQRRPFGPSSAGIATTAFENDCKTVLPWISCCFAACLYQNNKELAATSLANAKIQLQSMLMNKNAMLLTGLNHMLALLHMHQQGSVAESVMNAALEVAVLSLAPQDPVRTTIQWMTAASGQKLEQSGLTSQSLRDVLQEFMTSLGPDHPHTLTATYNLSFQLLLDGNVSEPQILLQNLYEKSKAILGRSALQTITALTTLSRAQSNEGHHRDAIETMEKAISISEATFYPDLDHPFRLESKRRLAQLYEKLGQKEVMEPLYWDVLRGRIKMLGKHSYTFGAKRDLIQLLKDLGKWDDEGQMERRVSDLFFPGYEEGAGFRSF
jgi:hypothetical protein